MTDGTQQASPEAGEFFRQWLAQAQAQPSTSAEAEQDSPEGLRGHADALIARWHGLLAQVQELPLEAARLRAKATALEAVDAARVTVAEAEAALEAAQAVVDATAAPEQDAAVRATSARQDAETAADRLAQAREARDDPARIRQLLADVNDASLVSEWEAQALAGAQEARRQASHDRDAARTRLEAAQGELAARQAEADAPLTSPARDLGERFEALIVTWPLRVALRNQPGHGMDETDLGIARGLCAAVAADLQVCPAGIAHTIAAAAVLAARTRAPGEAVVLPYIGEATWGALAKAAEEQRLDVRKVKDRGIR